MRRIDVRITGSVQGVFFRQGVKAEAERLGITGFTRNEPGGSVTITAEGDEENLQKLVEWCRKGTKYAKVKKVLVDRKEANVEFKSFEIK